MPSTLLYHYFPFNYIFQVDDSFDKAALNILSVHQVFLSMLIEKCCANKGNL